MARETLSKFVEVDVEPGPASESGVSLRFKQIDELREVHQVDYETVDGLAGRFAVVGCDEDREIAARGAHVEDSSDGVVWLVVGGTHGLLLRHDSGVEAREPYLVLSRTAHVM